MSPTGQYIPPLLVFPRKYMKQELTNGTLPGSVHSYHPSGWIQSEIFTKGFSSFHQTYKANKTRSCYLSTGRVLFTHKDTEGLFFSSRVWCWHNLPPTLQQPQNSTLVQSFHGAPENIILPRNWKIAPFKPRASRHRLTYWRTIQRCIEESCNRRDSF